MEIKTYREGEDLVVVFKNAAKTEEDLIKGLLSVFISAEDEEVADEYVADPDPRISYTNNTGQVIYNDEPVSEILGGIGPGHGDNGYRCLSWLLEHSLIDPAQESSVLDRMDEYFEERFALFFEDPYGACESCEEEEIKGFYLNFGRKIEPYKEQILEQSGLSSFKEFLGEMDECRQVMADLFARYAGY